MKCKHTGTLNLIASHMKISSVCKCSNIYGSLIRDTHHIIKCHRCSQMYIVKLMGFDDILDNNNPNFLLLFKEMFTGIRSISGYYEIILPIEFK